MIPTYSFPCLAHSTDNTALFLVGVTETIGLINVNVSQLEFNTVDLTYIDTPSVRLLHSEVDLKRWSPSAPKLCSNYPGAITTSNKPERGGRAVNPRIHIQQFSGSWTFDLNAVPGLAAGVGGIGVGGAGDATFEKPKKNKNNLSSVSFLSPKQFAIVGQAGENMYGVGKTDEVNKKVGSSWRMFVVDATENVDSLVSGPPQWSPSETTLLTLGTFITTTTTTTGSIGHLIAFDSTGTSGQIFPTVSSDKQVQIQSPFPVQMNNITLSSGAIPVHQGGTGFILDQAKDGTVIIYSITPGQSPGLLPIQPAPASNVPRFSEFMVATSTTGGSDSRIIIYSVIEGNPRFNSFDVGVKVWSGPALIPQSTPFGQSGGGGLIPTTSLPDGGNSHGGSGNGNGVDGSRSGGKASSGAVIGGAVAGGLILIVLAAMFIVRSRKQRSSHASHWEKGSNRGGTASALGREESGTDEGGEEEGLAFSDYHRHHQETLSSRPAPGEFRPFASAGSFATSNTTASSSSAVPLIYMSPPPLAPRPSSTPPTSLPLLAQRPLLSQTQPQRQQQQQHVTQQLYNAGRSFSDSTIYQAQQPNHAATFPHRMDTYSPNRNQTIHGNGNGDDDDDDNDEEEPYTLPAPIIVAPTPKPHKAELFE